MFNPDWLALESVSSFPWNTHAFSLIRPVMLGLCDCNRSHPPLLPAPSCSTNQHLSIEQGRKSRGGCERLPATFPSSWPLLDRKRPPSFRGLLSADDPQRSYAVARLQRLVTEQTGRSWRPLTGKSSPEAAVGPLSSIGRQCAGYPSSDIATKICRRQLR